MFKEWVGLLDAFPASMLKDTWEWRQVLDDTLIMTATVLLSPRVEKLKIKSEWNREHDTITIDNDPNVYSFYWLESKNINPEKILEPIKGDFKEIKKLPTHENFLSEKLSQKIFLRIMPNENTVCIFTDTITSPLWHACQFLIPKYFNIFKEKPLSKNEISFLETLTQKTRTNYISKVKELLNSKEFRSCTLKMQLNSFEKKLYEKKVEAAQTELNTIEQTMRDAMEEYRKACDKRMNAIATLNGMRSMAEEIEERTELQNYLLNNNRLSCVQLDGSTISFIVKTYLAPHHIEEWETMSRSNRMFDGLVIGSSITADEVKMLLDAILSEDRCLKMKMCAYFSMDYFGNSVTSRVNFGYASMDDELKDYIPNPHLHIHNCFGQNKLAILDQLISGDAIGAIECAIACAQRVNILESMTFHPFVRRLLESDAKCLVTEDGKALTPKEAIEYLKWNKK